MGPKIKKSSILPKIFTPSGRASLAEERRARAAGEGDMRGEGPMPRHVEAEGMRGHGFQAPEVHPDAYVEERMVERQPSLRPVAGPAEPVATRPVSPKEIKVFRRVPSFSDLAAATPVQRTASGNLLAAGPDASEAIASLVTSLETPGSELEIWDKAALARTLGTNLGILHPLADRSHGCEWISGGASRCSFVVERENGWAVWVPGREATEAAHHRGIALDVPLTGGDGLVFAAAVAANHRGAATAFARAHGGAAARSASLWEHPVFAMYGHPQRPAAQPAEKPTPTLSDFAAAVNRAVRAEAQQHLITHPRPLAGDLWRACTDVLEEVQGIDATLAHAAEADTDGASAAAYCLINKAAGLAPALGPKVAKMVDKKRDALESRFW